VLANKESASTRSAISVVAYQLSSQLPVYEDRLNSSPLDKTVVETNLSTVFDRLFYIEKRGGHRLDVIVATSAYGNYLKTDADREQPDKLLSLPTCP